MKTRFSRFLTSITDQNLQKMKEEVKKYFPDRFEDTAFIPQKFGLTRLFSYMGPKAKCEKVAQSLVQESEALKLMVGAMKKYGCDFQLARHVSCERCNDCSGGFDPDTNQIILCINGNMSPQAIGTSLLHEMIHMFDYCRAKFDYNNLEHIACSEVRAANIANCTISDSIKLGTTGVGRFLDTQQECIRKATFMAVKAYSPNTEPSEVMDVVDRVFPTCYRDLEPFGLRPREKMHAKRSYRERRNYGYY